MPSLADLLTDLRNAVSGGSPASFGQVVTALQQIQDRLERELPSRSQLVEIQAALHDAEPFIRETGGFLEAWQSSLGGSAYTREATANAAAGGTLLAQG